MNDDLRGYIRQSDAAEKYGVTEAAITLRRKRATNPIRSITKYGAVFVFEADMKNFTRRKPGPKPSSKRARKRSKVA